MDDMSPRRFALALIAIVLVAAALRTVFPTADPPWRATVGVVWHDEGAWTHNARNRALFGAWRLDEWNPMYIAPVFTGLEYLSFAAFGVGLKQARLVPETMGVVSVLLLGLAVTRIAGRRAGLFAAAMLATSYVYVTWNRAALLETTMTVWLVVAFYGYVRSLDSPRWGLIAGAAVWLAFFSKAAAAFFLPALGLVALWPLLEPFVARPWKPSANRTSPTDADSNPHAADRGAREQRAGLYTVAGLIGGGLLALALFVGPNWTEYWFYNWQISVTRKPGYTVKDLLDRVTWFPILHDFFTRMWVVWLLAIAGIAGRVPRWRSVGSGERLLLAWLLVGVFELLVHDVGNERRLVFLAPAAAAMAALVLARGVTDVRSAQASTGRAKRAVPFVAILLIPVVFYAMYVAVGPIVRLPFLYQVKPAVRLSALVALVLTAGIVTWKRRLLAALPRAIPSRIATAIVLLVIAGDLAQFVQWAAGRTYRNYEAMQVVARRLPPDTLVQGKLANGLALESRIRPLFIGRGFGNYADRLQRDDVRYVLTYISPEVGYEGSVILDVLEAFPQRRVLWTVPVAETTCGCDAAGLIEKRVAPGEPPRGAVLSLGGSRPR